MADYMLFTEVMALRQEVERIRDQRDKALQERDEARRLFCEWSAGSDRPGEAKEDIASTNGWRDLYEKKTP